MPTAETPSSQNMSGSGTAVTRRVKVMELFLWSKLAPLELLDSAKPLGLEEFRLSVQQVTSGCEFEEPNDRKV